MIAAQSKESTRLTSAGEPDPIPRERRRAWVREWCRREGVPTPGLIYCRATLIRNGWSEAEALARRGVELARHADGRRLDRPAANPIPEGRGHLGYLGMVRYGGKRR